jgi:hypothetical protein
VRWSEASRPIRLTIIALLLESPLLVACAALSLPPGGGPAAAAVGVGALVISPFGLVQAVIFAIWAFVLAARRRADRAQPRPSSIEMLAPWTVVVVAAGGGAWMYAVLGTAT